MSKTILKKRWALKSICNCKENQFLFTAWFKALKDARVQPPLCCRSAAKAFCLTKTIKMHSFTFTLMPILWPNFWAIDNITRFCLTPFYNSQKTGIWQNSIWWYCQQHKSRLSKWRMSLSIHQKKRKKYASITFSKYCRKSEGP